MNDRRKCTPDYVYDNICDLRAERSCRGLTREDLSVRSGVPVYSIRDYEQLKAWPGPGNYNRLARCLHWKLWEM